MEFKKKNDIAKIFFLLSSLDCLIMMNFVSFQLSFLISNSLF